MRIRSKIRHKSNTEISQMLERKFKTEYFSVSRNKKQILTIYLSQYHKNAAAYQGTMWIRSFPERDKKKDTFIMICSYLVSASDIKSYKITTSSKS